MAQARRALWLQLEVCGIGVRILLTSKQHSHAAHARYWLRPGKLNDASV